ncbi:hypothetical protein ETAA8_54190 [Anatilimnocola aggregata]|uniref:WD40 repeat domain-containing protein n=1 Tax=Anatilimnocola aggregata TaxID=2528021 RepID=A0A517YJA4_9BACT|nr:hypothetical protein [Anatilimnocola aggregata]QDU30299.1 hypothetical protein ETAA8_54190 [Anatilimnocola aggregata]
MQLVCQCTRCGQRYQVAPEWAGKTANCQNCGSAMQIPAASGPAPTLQPLSGGTPAWDPKPAAPGKPPQPAIQPPTDAPANGQPVVWMFAGGAGVAGLFVIILIVVMFTKSVSNSGPATAAFAPPPATEPAQTTLIPLDPFSPQPLNRLPDAPSFAPARVAPVPANEPATAARSTIPATAPRTTSPVLPAAKPSVVGGAEWGSDAQNTTKTSNPSAEAWGGDSIPVKDTDDLTFGPTGCPTVIVGNQVWNLADKKGSIQLAGEFHKTRRKCLSPDGLTFAASSKSSNREESGVQVWDTQTGKIKFTVPGIEDHYAILLLLSNDALYIGGRREPVLEVYSLETGERTGTRNLTGARLSYNNVCMTLDGKYLATPVDSQITVFRLADGRAVAGMASPKGEGRDHVFTLAWMKSLAFASDAQELAMVSTHPAPRLMCWNNRGKLLMDQPFRADRRVGSDATLQWFPDRSAWLIENDIIDRASGIAVLSIKEKFAQHLQIHIYDDNHLIGTFPSDPGQVEMLNVPWKEIRASIAALQSGTGAVLTPVRPVSIRMELGTIRGDQNETVAALYKGLTDRLNRDNLKVQDGQKTYFRMRFTENAGDTLPIYERQSVFAFRDPGRDTGRTATEAVGSLAVELFVEGNETPIWRDTIKGTSSRSFSNTEINDESVRKSMIDRITSGIGELDFPYFIPESKELLALPIVIR